MAGILINGVNYAGGAGTSSGDSIQVDTLSAPSASDLGKIYQYTGNTTTQYTKGYFYECVLDGSTYKWQVINTQASGTGSGGDIQSSTIPTASAAEEGKIIQYTGETNSQFKKGYFYECVNDGGTYKWQPINTQEGGSAEIETDPIDFTNF